MKALILVSVVGLAAAVMLGVWVTPEPRPAARPPAVEDTEAQPRHDTLVPEHTQVGLNRVPAHEETVSPVGWTDADEVARLETQVADLWNRVALAEQAANDADLELLRCRLGDEAMLTRYVASGEYTEEGRKWIEWLSGSIPSVVLLPGEATWIVAHAEEWRAALRFTKSAIQYLGPDRVLAALTEAEVIELFRGQYTVTEFEQVFGADWRRRRPDVELPDWVGMWD